MHQNYYFLRQLSGQLQRVLEGRVFMEAFSQERDEILFVFSDSQDSAFYIKASLRSDFSCLSFPERFDRARRNSVNLFTQLYGMTVVRVKMFANERAFGLELNSGEWLVFKLFGNRSNVLYFDRDGKVAGLFNRSLKGDLNLNLQAFDRDLDQTYDAFLQNNGIYEKLYPTFGKWVNVYLALQLTGVTEQRERWKVIQQVVARLENPQFYLTIQDHEPALTLLPVGEVREIFTDPFQALNAFYYAFAKQGNLSKEKAAAVRLIRKRKTQTENYLANAYNKLVDLEIGGKNEQMANILMANLHLVPDRADQIELPDFYSQKPVVIKLKKDLSPQKNAELFYRKAKNERIELEKLQDNIRVRESELADLTHQLEAVEGMEELKDLRGFLKSSQLSVSKAALEPAALFKKELVMGYTILIGRNAKNNDLLTRQYAHKDDLWLHARDVSGSHVVVKHQAGKSFPAPVIERAAELAAWYSKRKNDSLCPVIVTPKKFVRKLKGMPDGAVVVDKEEVVMVVPKM